MRRLLAFLLKKTGKPLVLHIIGHDQYGRQATETVETVKYPRLLLWLNGWLNPIRAVTRIQIEREIKGCHD